MLPSRILQVRETIAIVALITATSIIILYFCRALGNDLRLKKSRVKYDLQKFVFFSNGVVNSLRGTVSLIRFYLTTLLICLKQD